VGLYEGYSALNPEGGGEGEGGGGGCLRGGVGRKVGCRSSGSEEVVE